MSTGHTLHPTVLVTGLHTLVTCLPIWVAEGRGGAVGCRPHDNANLLEVACMAGGRLVMWSMLLHNPSCRCGAFLLPLCSVPRAYQANTRSLPRLLCPWRLYVGWTPTRFTT